MLTTLIKKELLDNMLSFRFIITLLLCLLLLPLGTYVSIQDYRRSLTDYQESQRLYRESMQGMRNAIEVDAKGLRPPSPFSIFASGLERFLPNEILSSRQKGLVLGNNRTMDDPLSILFGKLDFLFMVTVVISLLAVLFTFDSVTREKENGTLRLTLSNSFPRHQILMSKYLGHFLTFLFPFAVAMIIGMIIILASGTIPLLAGSNLLRFGIILVVALIFISVFFNLGIMISCLTHRSMTSQIILLFLWVLFIFVTPRISSIIAQMAAPAKTQQLINLEKTLIRKNIEIEKNESLKEEWVRLREGDPNQDYNAFRTPIVERLRLKEQQLLEAVDQDHLMRTRVQWRLAGNLARLSPLASLTFAVSELAQTGMERIGHLNQDAAEFHRAVSGTVHNQGYKDEIPGMGMTMQMGWIQLEQVPQFQETAFTLADSIGRIWMDILILILYNGLFFITGYVAFLRYDIR